MLSDVTEFIQFDYKIKHRSQYGKINIVYSFWIVCGYQHNRES